MLMLQLPLWCSKFFTSNLRKARKVRVNPTYERYYACGLPHTRYFPYDEDCFSPLISVKVKKILRKVQSPFQEKLGKLRLRQNDGFRIKVCSQE